MIEQLKISNSTSNTVRKLNVHKPTGSFLFQRGVLTLFGLWPLEIENSYIVMAHKIYGIGFLIFFLHLYSISQILFFFTVEDLKSASDGLFLLLTQISLVIKLQIFIKNFPRIKKLYNLLATETFLPLTEEEECYVEKAMRRTMIAFSIIMGSALCTISAWATFPLVDGNEPHLPLAAWYPFQVKSKTTFYTVYLYQIIGCYISAAYNSAFDTLCVGFVAHLNAQIQRLGSRLTNIGRISATATTSNDGHSDEIINCILFHKKIISFCDEIQNIFRNAMLVQMVSTVLIICMTAYQLLVVPVGSVQFLSMCSYLITMTSQVFLPCWMGNEVIYSSYELSSKAFACDVTQLNKKSAKLLMIFMQRCDHRLDVKAGTIIKFSLSLETFLGILKTSYSYFAVLQSVQKNY